LPLNLGKKRIPALLSVDVIFGISIYMLGALSLMQTLRERETLLQNSDTRAATPKFLGQVHP